VRPCPATHIFPGWSSTIISPPGSWQKAADIGGHDRKLVGDRHRTVDVRRRHPIYCHDDLLSDRRSSRGLVPFIQLHGRYMAIEDIQPDQGSVEACQEGGVIGVR